VFRLDLNLSMGRGTVGASRRATTRRQTGDTRCREYANNDAATLPGSPATPRHHPPRFRFTTDADALLSP
jgi:hypothetical protein